jgi:hypothetical protein
MSSSRGAFKSPRRTAKYSKASPLRRWYMDISSEISGSPAFQLYINAKMKINGKLIRDEHRAYLEYHRNEVFRGTALKVLLNHSIFEHAGCCDMTPDDGSGNEAFLCFAPGASRMLSQSHWVGISGRVQ